MINFGGITHIGRVRAPGFPADGKYSLTGSVPFGCHDIVKADRAAIMGGRAWMQDGEAKTYKARYYASYGEAKQAVIDAGGIPCVLPGCACRRAEQDVEESELERARR